MPEASPFLHDTFIRAALAIPPGDRYHPGLPSAYQRCKAEVVELLPVGAIPALPTTKQYFSNAIAEQAACAPVAPRCVAHGLLDADALAGESDSGVLLVVNAIERWLAEAESLGVGLRP